jgi:hypothetical protein
MSALIIFQPLVWVGVDMGKFLIELGGKKYFQHKITCSGIMLTSGWLAGCLVTSQ